MARRTLPRPQVGVQPRGQGRLFNPSSGLTSGIRSTTTNAGGAFSVETSRRGNLYKVEVSRKRLPSRRGHRHVCKRKTVTIERT